MNDTHSFTDYPVERSGRLSHILKCLYCKKSSWEINDTLIGHSPKCEYRLRNEARLQAERDAAYQVVRV